MVVTVALVGHMAGGKGSVSDMLTRRGYTHFSYGGEIAKELDLRMPGVTHTRDLRSDTAEILRLTLGTDILARRVAADIDAERAQGRAQKAVIDGLRHPDEIAFLRNHFTNLHVLGIIIPGDENDETRFQRYAQRDRELDRPITPVTFRHYDNRDRGIGEPPHGNQVDACLLLVDVMLENSGSVSDLEVQLNRALISRGIEGNGRGKEIL